MRDRSPSPRREREIPRYDGGIPAPQPKQQHPIYDPNQRPRRVISFRGSWWVWLSIGIGLAVVANALL